MLKLLKYLLRYGASLMTNVKRRSLWKKVVLLAIVIIFAVVWFGYFQMGLFSFNAENAVSIYGTVVQGMSGLLSVSIAVIIFRIQSLENRLHSLEDSTIDYTFQIIHHIYPKWLPELEESIRNGSITNKYYKLQKARAERQNLKTGVFNFTIKN